MYWFATEEEVSMETPTQRMIRIGKATVGLVGLDRTLNALLARPDVNRQEAVDELYRAVVQENYIPTGLEDVYRQSLAREYDRLKEGKEQVSDILQIRVLGTGCVSCNNLQGLVIEIMTELGVAADVFQVHDPDEIGRFGVMRTPALVINGKVVCSGRLPSRAQVEEWLREMITELG